MPPAPRTKAGDVREEQRRIGAFLAYAGADLEKGIERAGLNNLDLATVSGLHAVGQMLECSKLMDHDPQYVEEVRSWWFGPTERLQMRDRFFLVLKPNYDNLEDRLDSFSRGLRDRGYSAVFLALKQLRAWNAVSDPAAKQQIEDEIDRVVTNVTRQAMERPGGGSDANTGITVGGDAAPEPGAGGYGPGADNGAGGFGPQAGGTAPMGGVNAYASPGGVTVTDGNGHSIILPGATLNPDGTVRLADGRTVDLRGASFGPGETLRLANGDEIGGNGPQGGSSGYPAGPGFAGVPDANAHFVDANGNEVVIPADFNWRNGVATGIEKVYVGGRGGRLLRETQVTFRPTPGTQPNTYVVNRQDGEVRSWAFDVTRVPGSEKKSTGSLTVAFALNDRNGSSAFTTENWTITGPSGQMPLENASGNQATATFTSSGDYELAVTGKTEWGSDFTIRKTFPVGVE